MLENILDALPECSYEGVFVNRKLSEPDKCHRDATWVARYPKCGHSEPWCVEHHDWLLNERMHIICFCLGSVPARKAEWREL